MYVGALELDVLLGDVHSLKEKRSLVRPVVAELHRRALLGVTCVAADHAHVVDVLDRCERFVAGRPELELLSARQRMLGPDDEETHHG